MELQQKLEESREEPRTLGKSEHQAGIVHEFQEEYVESLVDGFLKADEKAKLIFSQTADSVTTASLSSCQENVQHDSLQNISQKSLYVGPLTDEVTQLNTSIQSLKTQQKELTANISSLREEQKEVALSAKLSCLVVKCQERNSLLAEMMKSMHRRGCLEPRLTQQAEHLLSDAALQEYTAAFSPKSKSQLNDFTRDFFSVFQGCNSGFMPDPTGPVESSCLIKHPKEVSPVPGAQFAEIDSVHLKMKEKCSNPAEFGELSQSPTAVSSKQVSPSRRLSSPEKILNLQEELQRTLMDISQVPSGINVG
uniref:Uncharacterized protein n=1 Tax=Cyprinodon variegatus TaxID=28743 RepID=A0A3Q2CP06_CYPVA